MIDLLTIVSNYILRILQIYICINYTLYLLVFCNRSTQCTGRRYVALSCVAYISIIMHIRLGYTTKWHGKQENPRTCCIDYKLYLLDQCSCRTLGMVTSRYVMHTSLLSTRTFCKLT